MEKQGMGTVLSRLGRVLGGRPKRRPHPIELLDPVAAFDAALTERRARYEELKRSAAAVFYVKNKLEGDLGERRADLARVHHELRDAVRARDRRRALELIERRAAHHAELADVERELTDVQRDVEEAKDHLVRAQGELRSLEREKLRAMATLSTARARARLSGAIDAFGDGEPELERVRGEVARLAHEHQLDRELARGRDPFAPRSSEDSPAGAELDAGSAPSALAELRALELELASPRGD